MLLDERTAGELRFFRDGYVPTIGEMDRLRLKVGAGQIQSRQGVVAELIRDRRWDGPSKAYRVARKNREWSVPGRSPEGDRPSPKGLAA